MKIVRWIVGRIILALDFLFAPKSAERAPAEQAKIDARAQAFELYQFEACPFCVKVRRHLKASGVKIPLRDATKDPFRAELIQEGGKLQAPCLKISEPGASPRWLYESSDIIRHLDRALGLNAN